MNFVECVSLLGSCIAVAIAFATLQQNRNIIEESNRAYIVVYVETLRTQVPQLIIIKNCGRMAAHIHSIKFDPSLNYIDTTIAENKDPLEDYQNISIAPNQSFQILFSFHELNDNKHFRVTVKYECNSKIYNDMFTIDTSYFNFDLRSNPKIESFKQGLGEINKSIRELSERHR